MRRDRLVNLIIIVAVVAIAGFFYKRYHIAPAIDMPAIALTDMNSNKVNLQSYSGHPLFLNFFATWCGPCIRELPDIIDLKNKLKDKELQVICISDEPIEKLQRLQGEVGSRLVILHAENSLHDIGIYTYPTNYIFNARGRKIYDKVNPDHWNDPVLVEQIRSLLD